MKKIILLLLTTLTVGATDIVPNPSSPGNLGQATNAFGTNFANYFVGNGIGLTNLSGTNLVGTLTNNTSGSAGSGWPAYPTTNNLAVTNGTYPNMTVGTATYAVTAGTATNSPLGAFGSAATNPVSAFDASGTAQNATNNLPSGIWTLGSASQSNSSAFDLVGAGVAAATASTNGGNIVFTNALRGLTNQFQTTNSALTKLIGGNAGSLTNLIRPFRTNWAYAFGVALPSPLDPAALYTNKCGHNIDIQVPLNVQPNGDDYVVFITVNGQTASVGYGYGDGNCILCNNENTEGHIETSCVLPGDVVQFIGHNVSAFYTSGYGGDYGLTPTAPVVIVYPTY